MDIRVAATDCLHVQFYRIDFAATCAVTSPLQVALRPSGAIHMPFCHSWTWLGADKLPRVTLPDTRPRVLLNYDDEPQRHGRGNSIRSVEGYASHGLDRVGLGWSLPNEELTDASKTARMTPPMRCGSLSRDQMCVLTVYPSMWRASPNW